MLWNDVDGLLTGGDECGRRLTGRMPELLLVCSLVGLTLTDDDGKISLELNGLSEVSLYSSGARIGGRYGPQFHLLDVSRACAEHNSRCRETGSAI